MTAVEITSDDGLTLVGHLDGPPDPKAILVFCHAHPKMGGTMESPLILALRDELTGRGWTVLRFNFRGIDGSEGEPSDGTDEVADAEGALRYVRAGFPTAPVAIAGWSFGGSVAIRTALRHPELAGVVGIAPAVRAKPGITAGLPDAGEVALDVPLLVVIGDNDDVVAPADVRNWTEAAGGEFVEIKAANHFFWAKYPGLGTTVAGWLDERLT